PAAFERMDLRAYDLVISDSSAFAKAVVTRPDALHICYCHTPMRWAWSYEDYVEREQLGWLARAALPLLIRRLRHWDFTTAARVDYFVANSPAVVRRIAKYYRRQSVFIPPPVDTRRFFVAPRHGDYFLIVSRLAPYKRIDLAVQACSLLNLPLRIIGTGRDEGRLRRLAGPSVRFLGWQSDDEVRRHLAHCRALILPGEEDFGLAPVEAQASGRPVIAYGRGGALATVVEGSTGLFFYQPTAEALAAVVDGFCDDYFDPYAIRRHAEQFDATCFSRRFQRFIEARLAAHPAHSRPASLELSGPGPGVATRRTQLPTDAAAEADASDTRPASPVHIVDDTLHG